MNTFSDVLVFNNLEELILSISVLYLFYAVALYASPLLGIVSSLIVGVFAYYVYTYDFHHSEDRSLILVLVAYLSAVVSAIYAIWWLPVTLYVPLLYLSALVFR